MASGPLPPAWPQALSARVPSRELVPGAQHPPPQRPKPGNLKAETLCREPPWSRGPQGQPSSWGRSAACWWGWRIARVPSSSQGAWDGAWQWLRGHAGAAALTGPCVHSVVHCESHGVRGRPGPAAAGVRGERAWPVPGGCRGPSVHFWALQPLDAARTPWPVAPPPPPQWAAQRPWPPSPATSLFSAASSFQGPRGRRVHGVTRNRGSPCDPVQPRVWGAGTMPATGALIGRGEAPCAAQHPRARDAPHN